MNEKEALDFLLAHQPMPTDDKLSKDLIEKYDSVRKYFISNPDPRCIKLFLHSFGDKDGLGVYQLVEDVFANFSSEVMIPILKAALNEAPLSSKYLILQICANFPSDKLISDIEPYLISNDTDIKESAIIAVAQIKSSEAVSVLIELKDNEQDEEIIDLIDSLL